MIPSFPIPRLLLIGNRFSRPEIADVIIAAVESGVTWVQLRDHEIGDEEFKEAAFRITDRIRAVSGGALISINTRIQIASRLSIGGGPTAGIHIGTRGPSVEETRRTLRADTPVGVSVHSVDQISGGGIDYFLWSPVFPTASKPGNSGTGIQELGSAVKAAKPIPVIALGGITPENTEECLRTRAHGVAVLSGILSAENIAETVGRYLASIAEVYPVTDPTENMFERGLST